MKKYKLVKIDGMLEVPEHLTSDEVLDQFIEWVESRAFFFGGGVNPCEEDKKLYDIEMETEELQKEFEEKHKELYGDT